MIQLPMEVIAPIVMYMYGDAGVTNETVAKVAAGGTATGAEKLKSQVVRGVRRGATELKALQSPQTIEVAPRYPAPLATVSTPSLRLQKSPTAARPKTSRK